MELLEFLLDQVKDTLRVPQSPRRYHAQSGSSVVAMSYLLL